MRKIIAVGNPPYQEINGGFGASANPVYNVFIDKLLEFNVNELVFLIPAKRLCFRFQVVIILFRAAGCVDLQLTSLCGIDLFLVIFAVPQIINNNPF